MLYVLKEIVGWPALTLHVIECIHVCHTVYYKLFSALPPWGVAELQWA